VHPVITLPPAVQGLDFRVTLQTGGTGYSVKAGVGDRIVLNGTVLDDGDKITNAAPSGGHAVHFYTFQNGYTAGYAMDFDWIAVTEGGTWTDGGA